MNNKSSDSSTTDPSSEGLSSEGPSVPTEPSSTDDGELSSTVDTSESEAASAPSAPSVIMNNNINIIINHFEKYNHFISKGNILY